MTQAPPSGTTLRFDHGTLEVRAPSLTAEAPPPPGCAWDPRTGSFRAPAHRYADIVLALRKRGLDLTDEARRYDVLDRGAVVLRTSRPYQTEALDAWNRARRRGTVVLPTGSGKTHVAVLAIDAARRSTLVVAPTLDLVRQWFQVLRVTFGQDVGLVGGGEHTVLPLTVTTYDSAYIHMEHLGSRFGLVVFDECHHLPGETYQLAARLSLAPFRLGLTATPERADGRESAYADLGVPIVYRREITELAGEFLAEYETTCVTIDLTPEDLAAYEEARGIYLAFLRMHRIDMGSPRGWTEFVILASRGEDGRRAMKAYRRQRTIALANRNKLEYVEHLLRVHRGERVILFTQDNDTAYVVAERFLVPVITHQTGTRERADILSGLAEGRYGAVVTSKVLNEGVDIPSASVAVVLSGSGSVREHVQRLGRILRKRDGKQAVLYELVSAGTNEAGTSDRRREHSAYQRSR